MAENIIIKCQKGHSELQICGKHIQRKYEESGINVLNTLKISCELNAIHVR